MNVMAKIITEPSINISKEILEELCTELEEMGQVVVHCLYDSIIPTLIRIWQTTYLYDRDSPHNSELVHAENISYFPRWTEAKQGKNHFTLIFSGLPRTCNVFDLIEHCDNENGAFRIKSIKRNKSDIYYIQL